MVFFKNDKFKYVMVTDGGSLRIGWRETRKGWYLIVHMKKNGGQVFENNNFS